MGSGRRPRNPGWAALGALVVNFAKTYFTGAFPEYWLFHWALFVLVSFSCPEVFRFGIDQTRACNTRYAGNPLTPRTR